MATNLPYDVIAGVMALVGEHILPQYLVIKNKDAAAYFQLAEPYH